MKRNNIKVLLISIPLIAGGMFTACTDNFEELNTSNIQVDPNDLPFESQFAEPMQYCYPPQQNMFQFWTNLTSDMYCGYFMTPNGNFTNGDMGENRGHSGGMYENFYLHIFNNTRRIISKCEADGQPGLAGMMKVVQAYGLMQTTDAYGPIAYTSVLDGNEAVFEYDSQQKLYTIIINDLKNAAEAIKNMSAAEKDILKAVDCWCGGNVDKWVKVANTFRLRAALRLSKRAEEMKASGIDIEQVAKEAIEGGLLTAEDGDVLIDKGLENEMWLMFNWGDCGFNAVLSTILNGTNDPRLPLYMTKNTGTILKDGYKQETDGTYKNASGATVDAKEATIAPDSIYIGIRFASGLPAKPNQWSNFSGWIQGENGSSYSMALPIMKCAESYFLRAEAKLRWNIGQESVEQLYIDGIRTSMAAELKYRGPYAGIKEYKANAVEDYINSNACQEDFNDPADVDNSHKALNKLGVKWDEGATNEEKLQRIMTQKWLALFPLSVEAWSECRRTGYPILFPGVVNESQGAVTTAEGVRRQLYSGTAQDTNAEALKRGIEILNQENSSSNHSGDKGGTRVWWDNAKKGNF